MRVYELIQELCNYDADCEVEINCRLDKVEIDVDVKDGETENVLVDFEETCDVEVSDRKISYYNSKK